MRNLESIERTFVMIKPDGVKRGLVGQIFMRLEAMGLKLAACRMILPTVEQAKGNYPADNEEWIRGMGQKTIRNYNNDSEKLIRDLETDDDLEIGKKVLEGLVNYITSGPVILLVWEGNHAVEVVRKLAGSTSPDIAVPGTLRGDYGFDSPKLAVQSGRTVFQNLIHISDSPEEAEREIQHWFGDRYKYLGNYTRVDYVGSFEAFE